MMRESIHEIEGYGVVLPKIQNYYPVEDNEAGGFCWGFKYTSGVFEYFHHKNKDSAIKEREMFINALDSWYINN